MQTEAQGDGGLVGSNLRGRFKIWSPVTRVAVLRVSGYMQDELGLPMQSFLRERIRDGGPIVFFVDGHDFENYESAFRVRWMAFVKEQRAGFEALHFLARSPFVKMGVQVANLVLGGWLNAYTDRREFAAAGRVHGIEALLRDPSPLNSSRKTSGPADDPL